MLEKRYNATLRIGSVNEDLSKYLVADLGGTLCDAILDCTYWTISLSPFFLIYLDSAQTYIVKSWFNRGLGEWESRSGEFFFSKHFWFYFAFNFETEWDGIWERLCLMLSSKYSQLVSWKYTFIIFLGSISPVVSNLIGRMYPKVFLLFMENGDEET